MHLLSLSLSIVLRCGGQLLNVTSIFSSAMCIRWPSFALITVTSRCGIEVMLLVYNVNSNSNHYLFSKLPSVFIRVRHTLTAAAAHPLEFKVSRFRTSQFTRCFQPANVRKWNDLPDAGFHTGTLDGFQNAV